MVYRCKISGDSFFSCDYCCKSILFCLTMNDDPREVLVLLNTLGFVGITAEQLKAFMKDLKLHRKMKDRNRQERKEEIKKKIIDKQLSMVKEILREQRTEMRLTENTASTNSSNSYIDSSHVRVKVKCLSSEKENTDSTNSEGNSSDTRERFTTTKSACASRRILDRCSLKSNSASHDYDKGLYDASSRNKVTESLKKEHREKASKPREKMEKIHQEKAAPLQPIRPMSAPNILEHGQDQVGSSQAKSTTSTKNTHSGTKSFIRPWRLQPDAKKKLSTRKCDPVALYQKYQQEWKQISFPGEAKHANVRWAIREKMLGGDPNPMPLPRKSNSLPTLRRK